ncbi:MAG: hypothetical protein V1875_09680 [Candidatus Altiarchaeota archaeon]
MSVFRSATGGGVILLGTLVLGVGYAMSQSTPLEVRNTTTAVLGTQMEQIGLMLIVGGIFAMFIISVLADLRIV